MPRLDSLKKSIPVIKKLGAEIGLDITEDEMAQKMNLSREEFEAYVNSPDKTPDKVLEQLWEAYSDLFKAVQRSNLSGPLRNTIALLKKLGKEKGMEITDKEVVDKLAIPREEYDTYIKGETQTPEEVLSRFRTAWPDLFKNVRSVTKTSTQTIRSEEDEDENE